MRFGLKIVVHLIVACVTALIVWHLWNGGSNQTRTDNSSIGEQTQTIANELATSAIDDESWQLTESSDPMTDEAITAAEHQFLLGTNQIELRIECKAERFLIYKFTAFKEDGSPSEYDVDIAANEMGKFGQLVRFSVRIDSPDGYRIMNLSSPFTEYRNQFTYQADMQDPAEQFATAMVLSGYQMRSLIMKKVAAAPSLRFRIPLRDGVEVLKVDQTDPAPRSVINQCFK